MYNMFDIELECLYFPGANVHETVSRGLRNGKYHYYDVIYLMTGINELSIRGKNRLVCPRFINDKDIMAHMQDMYISAHNRLLKYSYKVIICELVGLSFAIYNKGHLSFPEEQAMLNSAIMHLNKFITSHSQQSGIVSPWIADHVHKYRWGRLTHRYKGLMAYISTRISR